MGYFFSNKVREPEPASQNLSLSPKKELLEISNYNAYYGKKQVLSDINIKIAKNKVTAFIGPSGCGKSTLIRCINGMNNNVPIFNSTGTIVFDGVSLNEIDPVELRTKIGIVFQKPNPFPKSIKENVLYGPIIHNLPTTDDVVEDCLTKAGLWEEVKDRLNEGATGLSGGQQQRLCIARAWANRPAVILMDEPCSALDPIATAKIEALIKELSQHVTIIIVTHSMTQAKRVSDKTAFFFYGELLEYRKTEKFFENPKHQKLKDYLSGGFG